MSKEKIFNILYISLFAVVILALITGFYKFKPESMNTHSILFADNIDTNSNVENFTETVRVNPTMTFRAGDRQPVYAASEVIPKITALSTSITQYNTEIDQFNRLNDEDNIRIYKPYNDINDSLSSKIDAVINNVKPKTTDQTEITNKIKELQGRLDNIVSELQRDKILDPELTTAQNIKSLDNGMELSVYHDDNTNLYNITVNNGCLSTSDNGYSVEPCNIGSSKKQKFEMKNIFSDVEYAKNISPVYNSVDISRQSGINYPFSMMVSANNMDCLTNNHGEITVQPCSISKNQRWIPLQTATGKCATI